MMKVLYQCEKCLQYEPLENMYYCQTCQKLLCSSISCILSAIDYYYCPICFDTLTTTELKQYGYRCFSCFLCPMCNSQLCGLVDETTSSWEWTCFGCSWKSSLNAPTLLELKSISNKLIQQSQNNELNTLKSAAECVRFELGLSENTQPSPYSIPYTHSKKSNTQIHEERLVDIRRQQERIQSQIRTESLTLPFHPSLRAKRIIKCLSCNQEGSSGLLFKAQGQPLLGDSSLVKGHDSWFRVATLGLYSVPQFSIVQHDDENILLRIRNPASDPLSSIMGDITLTISSPIQVNCILPSFDEITVDYDHLKTVNENKPHVMETGMNFVIISIPKTESMILEASFSYQSSTRG
ncbi:hypothetical protein WA171_007361, partial [Blastocystis sp. BT1]